MKLQKAINSAFKFGHNTGSVDIKPVILSGTKFVAYTFRTRCLNLLNSPSDCLLFWLITAGLTFGTSNLKLEDMPYNKHTIDRMKQMFNIIVLPGKSRR